MLTHNSSTLVRLIQTLSLVLVSSVLSVLLSTSLLSASETNDAKPTSRFASIFAGGMINNKANELHTPWTWDWSNQHVVGAILGIEQQINGSPMWLGVELNLTGHFGEQEFFEVSVPVTLRYRFEEPWVPVLSSVGAGLGVSYTTEIPNLEVENRWDSTQLLAFWMLEAEFNAKRPEAYWLLRVQHRSEAFGTFGPDTGSNGIIIGYRQRF